MAAQSSGAPRPGWKESCYVRTTVQLLFSIPLVLMVLACWGGFVLDQWEALYGYGPVPDYGLPGLLMEKFRMYDSNADGCIDPYEFSRLQWEELQEEEGSFESYENYTNYKKFQFEDEEAGPGKEVVFMKAEMKPLNITTMTKFDSEDKVTMGSPENILPGLFKWQDVHSEFELYGTKNFQVFLPRYSSLVVGEPYYIIKDTNVFTPMNRYRPPAPSREHAVIHSILAQFHPQVFLLSRFGPKGSVAVVRAKNGATVEVMFRIHAEYQLNSQPDYPFWYTPAQFTGRLVIDRDCGHVHHFELHLPTDKLLNIDMEWISGPGDNEVDIGYMPLLRAFSSSSTNWKPELELPESLISEQYQPPTLNDISWSEEITQEDALRKLEMTMYPFKEVFYHSFLDSISSAVSASKLVHLIVLWGALDDQSC